MPSSRFKLQKYIKIWKYKTILIKITYFCNMKERINWIDWAKALAVCCVVFCHLPQSQEWYYYRFLQATIITIFFWVSGYLKKDRGSTRENWRKYWYGLIIPYIIYNVIVYPYWLLKYYILNGGWPDVFSALKPVFGALLFENENAFCEPLNGPLWYLPAILVMHILVDSCRKTRYQHIIMITLCITSYFVYAANKQYEFLPNLTFIGIISRLPFYYLGYAMGQNKSFLSLNKMRDAVLCFSLIALGVLFFQWHMQTFYSGDHMLHIALFYPVNLCFLFGVLYGCKSLNGIKSSIITNLSIGTLVIIGLHIILVTIANFTLTRALGISGGICYYWYAALPTAFIICTLLYPIILWAKQHFPILLGRKKL